LNCLESWKETWHVRIGYTVLADCKLQSYNRCFGFAVVAKSWNFPFTHLGQFNQRSSDNSCFNYVFWIRFNKLKCELFNHWSNGPRCMIVAYSRFLNPRGCGSSYVNVSVLHIEFPIWISCSCKIRGSNQDCFCFNFLFSLLITKIYILYCFYFISKFCIGNHQKVCNNYHEVLEKFSLS
jgi:hypothetical protein